MRRVSGENILVHASAPQAKATHRLHVIKKLKPFICQVIEGQKRGKYQSATTAVGEDADSVNLTEILRNDSTMHSMVAALQP